MPSLRKLRSRFLTVILPSSSSANHSPPATPTSPTTTSFTVLGRKERNVARSMTVDGSVSPTTPHTPFTPRSSFTPFARPGEHSRSYSLMTFTTNSSKETVEEGASPNGRKVKRQSRFREELYWDE